MAARDLDLSLIDRLALVRHQADMVSDIAKALMAGDERVRPELVASATLRLNVIVNSFMQALANVLDVADKKSNGKGPEAEQRASA